MTVSFLSFALAAVFAAPTASPPQVVRIDSIDTADTTQLPLTVDVLHRLTTFWTDFLSLPDSIRIVAQRAHQEPLHINIAEISWAGYRVVDLPAVVNMVALARQFPAVAAELHKVQLTASQWEQYRRSLFTAQLTGQQSLWQGPDSLTSRTVLWSNVEFLQTHLQDFAALQAVGMWVPKVRPKRPPDYANQMTPDTLRLSDAIHTAPVTLTNPDSTTREVWLALDCGAGRDSVEQLDLLTAAWHNRVACAWPWLGDFPQHLVLAPHEHRTFSLAVHPPLTLQDGEYTARLTWAAHVFTDLGETIMHDEIAIVYIKGPHHPRPARTQWLATQLDDHPTVQITPAVAVLDTNTKTTTITLYNSGKTSTDVWLALDCPWFHVNWTRVNMAGLVETQYELAWHSGTPNVALWLSGYPQHVILAPHERRTLTIDVGPVEVFGDPAGSYYARLVYVQAPVLTVTPAGDTTYVTPHGAVDLVYQKGEKPPQLTLQQLQRTPQPDGTSRVCMMMQQPGLGFVATVHAEIDDVRQGQVGVHDMAGTRGDSHASAWSMDTTVVVWELVHHNPFNPDTDEGHLVPPAPVCFRVPAVALGHYQLAVTATALEDTAKQRVVRATLPWEVP